MPGRQRDMDGEACRIDHGCFVTRLTPPGRSAVATLHVWGSEALACVSGCFAAAAGQPLERFPCNRIIFGTWQSPGGVPEEVVVCRRTEDVIEVHCHGGLAAPGAILAGLVACGAEEIAPEEWVRRWLPDGVAAAARLALAQVTTERTAAVLLDQYRGALRQALAAVVNDLRRGASEAAAGRLERLASLAAIGLHLTRPWRVVLAGPPNAGKSSLVNRLVGYDRAIVFDQPGTTRDLLTTATALDGWPVEFVDTAGLRASRDEIEVEGIARAELAIRTADLVLLVFDATESWDEPRRELAARHPQAIVLLNKCDLPEAAELPSDALRLSARTGQGVADLLQRIVGALCPITPEPGEGVPFTTQQAELILSARDALSRGDRQTAVSLLAAL